MLEHLVWLALQLLLVVALIPLAFLAWGLLASFDALLVDLARRWCNERRKRKRSVPDTDATQ